MKPADIRILVIAGSARRATNCPAADSKAGFLAARAKSRLPRNWTVDILDLANDYVLPKIQSCNACVSTSMALCVWPCNCYKRHSFFEPDLLWDEDVYGRLYAADAILICSPINWYGATSNLKLLFDRLVCMNGGNPDERLIKHKDGALAARLENSSEWTKLSLNHLEGRTAGFFIYGDLGGDEIDPDGFPKILRHKEYFDREKELEAVAPKYAYRPIVWQCRYSGIEVPEELIKEVTIGQGKKYNRNQIPELQENKLALSEFDAWLEIFQKYVANKGKVPPSRYPVPLGKPDSALPPFLRQLQLLFRTVLGSLWKHSLGYFTSRRAAKKLRLYKN